MTNNNATTVATATLPTPIGYTVASKFPNGDQFAGDDQGELFFESSMEALAYLEAEGIDAPALTAAGAEVYVVALIPVHVVAGPSLVAQEVSA